MKTKTAFPRSRESIKEVMQYREHTSSKGTLTACSRFSAEAKSRHAQGGVEEKHVKKQRNDHEGGLKGTGSRGSS